MFDGLCVALTAQPPSPLPLPLPVLAQPWVSIAIADTNDNAPRCHPAVSLGRGLHGQWRQSRDHRGSYLEITQIIHVCRSVP